MDRLALSNSIICGAVFIPKINTDYVKATKVKFLVVYAEVFKFSSNSEVLFRCIVTSVTMMLLLFPFGAMLSIYVKEGLHLAVSDYDYLSGAEAAGAVLAGTCLDKIFKKFNQLSIKWYATAFLSGICLLLLLLKPGIIWIYLILFLFGLLSQLFRSFSRVMFQKNTPDSIRGKVMSISISDSGVISLGLLFFTFLADKYSIETTVLYMGILFSLGILLLFILFRRKKDKILKINLAF